MRNFKFCPYCGSRVKKTDEGIECLNCGRKVFFTSDPSAGAFIIKGDKVLLVKRGIEPRKGYFDFPGGFLHMGEHPEEGLKREILEETGLKIQIIGILGIYINNEYTYQNEKIYPQDTIFLAKMIGGKAKANDDVASLHWVLITNPPKEVSFPSVAAALKDLKKWYKIRAHGD